MARIAIFLIFAATFATVMLSTYRFRLEPTWRMDPIPFAFFLAAAVFLGRVTKR